MRCTLLGSSGLVGAACLRELSKHDEVDEIICPVRDANRTEALPKARIVEIDFADLKSHRELFQTDAVICCLGTTRKKAGSNKARDYVDLQIPLTAAGIAKECGAKHFLVVSAQGANAKSWIAYNRAKGLLEQGLIMLDFDSLTIARPSLLLGARKEKRFMEDLAAKLFTRVPPPVFWRPVFADSVARALVESMLNPPEKKKRILFNRILTMF